MKPSTLTVEALKAILSCDPETGVFTRVVSASNAVKVGYAAGTVATNGRRYIDVLGRKYLAHRLAWFYVKGEWPTGYVVPNNGDYLDARIDNLSDQIPTDVAKRVRSKADGTAGVTWDAQRQKWFAKITVGYKQKALGRFDRKEDAIAAVDAANALVRESDVEVDTALRAKTTLRVRHRDLWRRTTEVHGQTGWESFEAFASDVGAAPKDNHSLVPVDASLPIGPSNFAWSAPLNAGFDVSTREGRRAYDRAQRGMHPNRYRDHELRKRFGLTLADYQTMLADQSGVCAVCEQPEKDMNGGKVRWLAVDHNHTTGAIRGLLCGNCNKAIGFFCEDARRFHRAAAYLDRHEGRGADIVQFPAGASSGILSFAA